MSTKHRPRRSVLYMPGANARALEKSRSLPADALIFDLEDAVAPDAKLTARVDLRSRGCSRARRKADRPQTGHPSRRRWRLRQARDFHPHQRVEHAVGL
ncbi:MAG: hypothetical protein JRF54_12850 [Deltaproteobacteria bacterium]|nr:hypothetical protein [Deltaproteobacteria bacterium]